MTAPSANFAPLTPLSFLRRSGTVFPDRPAIVYGERRWTYREFLADAERLARAIRGRIEPGERVAFLAPNIPELLIAHFAVALAQGVLVAINSRLSGPEVAYILDHSGASLLFVDAEIAQGLGDLRAASPDLREVIEIPDPEFGAAATGAVMSYAAFLESADPAAQVRWEIDDELEPFSINYTSGTTGRPKGVMYSHRGAYLNAMGEIFHNGFTGDSVYLWTLPMFHCNGWCTPWAVTGAAALHVCLRAVRTGPIWEAIDAYGVTNLCGSPTVCSTIANAPEAHALELPLRITTAGAPPSPTIIAQLEQLGAEVVHVYGLTEVYGPFTINEHQTAWDALPAGERAALKARQGVGMIQAEAPRVVDDAMLDVPADGETLGEVVLRGNNVMLGYFRDEAATEESFRGGWYHSGDLGVMHPDGYIELKDRAKDLIISGGENISTIEVENALLSHPAVLDVAVVAFAHERWGERPKAYVVLREGAAVGERELLDHARGRIARFKVPDYVVFRADLPRTVTGKVTKMVLRALDDVPAGAEGPPVRVTA